MHADDLDGLLRAFRASDISTPSWERRFRVRDSAGGWRHIMVSAARELVDQGLVWSGVMLDVTETQRLQDQLRYRDRRQSIGDVTAGITHKFNNMLAIIQPNLDHALAGGPDARGAIEDAARATAGAAELVRGLRALTRPDSVARAR